MTLMTISARRLGGLLPEVLEQYAFLFCDPIPGPSAADSGTDDPAISATVAFAGPVASGFCEVGAAAAICHEVAVNLLGLEFGDDPPPGLAEDGLKEVANILTGHVLTSLYGADVVFDIAAPEMGPAGRTVGEAAARDGECFWYQCDEALMWLRLGGDALTATAEDREP